MEDETYLKLFELSLKTKDKLVTPLFLDYFEFEFLGVGEKGIVQLIQNKYNPLNS